MMAAGDVHVRERMCEACRTSVLGVLVVVKDQSWSIVV